jgi:simple sugar transport system permease protein
VPNLGIFQSILAFDINIIGVVISAQAIWAILLMLVFGLILQYTKFGNHVYATGDDEEASRLNGIDVEKVKITNFILTSTLAAFAGILSVAYFGSIFSAAGRGIELTIIAGVIIGGTNLFGGEGSISGTFLGMLVIGFIPTLLVINNVAVEIGDLFTGAIIILAVIIDSLLR